MRAFLKTTSIVLLSLLLLVMWLNINVLSPNQVPQNAYAAVEIGDYSQAGNSNISTIFTPSVQYWGGLITKWAAEQGLDPNLAATVMQIESCGDPYALSSSGAFGLFQVMPFHFDATDDPYDPTTNARRGLNYLARGLTTAGGDARLALAGYNGGHSVISRAEFNWSAQTQRYVQYGYPIYQDTLAGLTTSPNVEAWYIKWGASMCKKASQALGLQ